MHFTEILAEPTSLPLEVIASLDRAIAHLTQHKDAWVQVAIAERINYLRQCMKGVNEVAEAWAIAACKAKGIDPALSLAGEEWITGPLATLLNLQLLIKTLEANGQPTPPSIFTRPDGQVVARIFPDNLKDRLLWLGFSGEVWMQPGKSATQGLVYRQKPDSGKVALVLGAGNISAIAAMDTLYKLFAEDQVVLLKMNPVNDYVGTFLERAFQPFIANGFLEIVYGGVEVGQYLCQHTAIDTIHITGSHHTHDAIVWGRTPTEQQERKAASNPAITKPITSELGCVTPILVVPGKWSEAEMQFQARHIASMVTHNASFNCVAAKVLVTAEGWCQREEFLQRVHQELAKVAPRWAYYPGAEHRYQTFLQHYPQAQVLGKTDTTVPWTVIPNVPPTAEEYALTTEAFCGVLAEVTLPSQTAPQFLIQAVEFANETVWGNLSCVLLVDPRTQKQYAAAVDCAIATLRYGAIGINVWTGAVFLLPSCVWGAFPGNSLANICSGWGVVHNTYLFEYPEKSVLHAPFSVFLTPIWFADHKNLQQVARRYINFLMAPHWGNFVQIITAALKG
ncbi:NAD-dependent aldehyde dehydrogenase [Leptolyngbyaceae cyanobacterium JSC-12]|nr:NAD-dependent aldehyde dehydrogenase [Leptolyngbyaceae cyanobacterium JSC-12]